MQTNLIIPDGVEFKRDYADVFRKADEMSESEKRAYYRDLCFKDMYFLLRYGCDLPAYLLDRSFVVERCKEADRINQTEKGMDGKMIMVFREGFKSLIFNCGMIIRKVLKYPELATCIFSYKKGRAVDHLKTIKLIFEKCDTLKSWFPDILHENPTSHNTEKWSEENGITVKRKTTRKEPTIMASGLVDGQPIGMHFNFLCFDDVVTKDSVKTFHMIEETNEAFELADNLGVSIPGIPSEKWAIGTFYKYGDTYCYLRDKEYEDGSPVYDLELIPCYDPDGKPYLHTKKQLEEKRAKQGRFVFSCQQLLNPVPADQQTFDIEQIGYYDGELNLCNMSVGIKVDPAHTVKQKRDHDPDFTAMWVVATDKNAQEYWIDGVYDRMKAPDAVRKMFELVEEYDASWVTWEEVAAQSDTQFIKEMMRTKGISFRLIPFNPKGKGEKTDRILTMLPGIEDHRILFPRKKYYKTIDGKLINLIDKLKKEMIEFPHGHDDFLDCGTSDTPKYGRRRLNDKTKVHTDYDNRPFEGNEPKYEGITSYV